MNAEEFDETAANNTPNEEENVDYMLDFSTQTLPEASNEESTEQKPSKPHKKLIAMPPVQLLELMPMYDNFGRPIQLKSKGKFQHTFCGNVLFTHFYSQLHIHTGSKPCSYPSHFQQQVLIAQDNIPDLLQSNFIREEPIVCVENPIYLTHKQAL